MSATVQSRADRIVKWLSSFDRKKDTIDVITAVSRGKFISGDVITAEKKGKFTLYVERWTPDQDIIELKNNVSQPGYPMSRNWTWILLNVKRNELYLSAGVTLREVADALSRFEIERAIDIFDIMNQDEDEDAWLKRMRLA
jgi:hypothetical protein